MGFRTVVVLQNDQAHVWENDPSLGKKIAHSMNFASHTCEFGLDSPYFGYGRVVECAHADLETLAVIENYGMRPIGHDTSRGNSGSEDATNLRLLKAAAAKMGYRLVKKSEAK